LVTFQIELYVPDKTADPWTDCQNSTTTWQMNLFYFFFLTSLINHLVNLTAQPIVNPAKTHDDYAPCGGQYPAYDFLSLAAGRICMPAAVAVSQRGPRARKPLADRLRPEVGLQVHIRSPKLTNCMLHTAGTSLNK
jgi:hypothetical protein